MGDTPKEPPARKPESPEEWRAWEEQDARERKAMREAMARKLMPNGSSLTKDDLEPPERGGLGLALMLRRDWGLSR